MSCFLASADDEVDIDNMGEAHDEDDNDDGIDNECNEEEIAAPPIYPGEHIVVVSTLTFFMCSSQHQH